MKNYVSGKIYDLIKDRPKTLLIGNGPINALGGEYSWGDLISKIAGKEITGGIPYSLKASVNASHDDKERREKYVEIFSKYKYDENPHLNDLMKYPWDAVLTTNYTYDIEYTICPDFVRKNKKVSEKGLFSTKRKRPKGYGHILLWDFNRFTIDGEVKNIWHIHGEIRNKSSIVLTHDEYARQVRAILNYISNRGYDYVSNPNAVSFESWIDYLVLGDLYIVGLGMDFSEFDIWWLLNRRKREKTGLGKLVYLNPYENKDEIYKTISMLGGEYESLGTKEDDTDKYKLFYTRIPEFFSEKVFNVKE